MASNNSELQWKTLFDNMQAKTDAAMAKKKSSKPADGSDGDVLAAENGDTKSKSSKDNKRLSVERIYQKKSQLEHILLRPDTYIGSVESVKQPMWVMDPETERMVQKEISFVPGLYKIFDEIMVNAADNKQRDPKMDCLKIDIDPENNKIKIWNNGKGIPVVEHKEQKMYVPTMIFGHLLTSSNYDDSEKKVTGGRNGYGAKLCNIFSNKFIVETSSKDYKSAFKQTWTENMSKTKSPTITDSKESDFTSVTFYPDLSKFKMEKLDDDVVALFTRRAYDIAAASKGVKVYLNGKRLPIKNFKDYVDLFIKDKTDDNGAPLKIVHEAVNDRWEIVATQSDKGFQQVSFVNSIATSKGGRHVDYIADQCVSKLIEVVKKKNKGGINIKPFQVKNHLWLFVNCLIENPTFDSQTKENMTKQAKAFGSKCQLSEKFITNVSKSGIVENILSWMKFKAQSQLNSKCTSKKHSKLKGIPKLDDANNAGTKNSKSCTLILTEGDSAKSLAVAGLGVVGRDNYGVFPLRGKLLNVREASHKQILENAEIQNIVKIMGLQFKEKYDDPTKLLQLRYGKIMIMTDQDQDGSHIKGLLINFIHHFWPSLLKHNFLEQFITPIVKVTKGKTEKSFYSIPEFEEWKTNTENWHTYKVKYYKGLGTSTSKEAKEYFSDMVRHRIKFHYSGGEDDSHINLGFSKKKCEERKEWLTNFMEEKKRRAEMGLPDVYLYDKDTTTVSYSDFVNRELILFSNTDLARSIPNLMDGLKPGQRKVIFTCIKRNIVNKEIKVAQLAGSVAELSAYHHGEMSLMGTIVNLAQNYVGSNNLNLLQPLGQFGTRIHGGKDAASPRYIFTMLSPLAKHVIDPNDAALLNDLYDDNQRIEPEWYCPIIPMVLVNGAEGIGTGWSTKIPNYDVREIVANLRRLLDDEEPLPMLPNYKDFRGTIEQISAGEQNCACHGEIAILDEQTIEITELPVRVWTQNYKENVLEPMLHGTEKTPSLISDYKEYHTDKTVRFVIKMTPEKLANAEKEGLHKTFKVSTSISINQLILFDQNGCIKRYESVLGIIREFYAVRLDYYQRRKDYLEGMLAAECLRLNNIARFIMEKIDGTVVIENKPKKELIQMLVRRGYDSDPVKAWKESQNKGKEEVEETEEEEEPSSGPDFNYILSMALWCLTKEKKESLLKQRDDKTAELNALRKKSPKTLWRDDLNAFMITLEEVEKAEKDLPPDAKPIKLGKLGKTGKAKKTENKEIFPSEDGERVVPQIFASLKARFEGGKKEGTKKTKVKKENADDSTDVIKTEVKTEDGTEVSPSGAAKTSAGRGRGRGRGRGAAGGGRGRGGAAAAKSSSPKKKGGKKRNPWSSDEEQSDKSDFSDMDDDEKPAVVIPRDTTSRRAAASKVSYKFDAEDEIQSEDDGSDTSFKAFDAETGNIGENGNASENEGSDFVISDNEPSPPKPKPSKPAPQKKKPAVISDNGLSDDEPSPPKAKVSKPASKKKAAISDDDISDDDGDFKPKAKPAAKKAPAKPAAKKAPAKKKVVLSDLSDDSEAEDQKILQDNKALYPSSDDDIIESSPPPKKAPAAKKPAAKKAAPKAAPKRSKKQADSGSDSDSFIPKKKAAVSKKKAKKDSDSEDEDLSFSAAPSSRATTGRARGKQVKYNLSSEDDDDFD